MTRKPGRSSSALGLARVVAVSATAVAAGVLSAGFSCVATAQAVEDSAEIHGRVEAYRSAWNTHDASALAAFFTDDADSVMGNRPARRGRQAIRDSWRDYFANQEPERHLKIVVNSVRFVAADVAIINVATTTGGQARQGEELPARRFRGTWVLRRQSGNWLISAMRGMPSEEDRVVLSASLDVTEALRPQIRAFVDAYEDAFNSHDPSVVSAFYRDDAAIIVRNGPEAHGGQAIQDWWRAYFSEPRPYRVILIIDEIRMITPDVALINIVGTGAALKSESQQLPTRLTRATWVVVRESSEWLIAALWVLPSEDDRIIRGGGR